MSPVLEMRGVSKVYGQDAAEVHALSEVDLAVEAGELVAVMGPSGSGKSTLLMIAGSLERPTRGQVIVGGVDVGSASPRIQARVRRRAIGYVFQDYNLLAGLTAIENVTLPLELDGVGVRRARADATEMLSELGLEDQAGRFPEELSGGERQRVALARATVGDRTLLLADEPTGALDSGHGEVVMRMLRRVCRGGVGGVIVTHDAKLASWADRVLFLRDGLAVDRTDPPLGPDSLIDARPV